MKTASEVIQEWMRLIQKNTVSSVGSITPPASRFKTAKVGHPGRAKQGIKKLKKRIADRWKPKTGMPAKDDTIYSPDGFSRTGIYILPKPKAKGKKKQRKNRHSIFPVLTTTEAVVKWWMDNSFVTAARHGERRVRKPKKDAKAFVSQLGVFRRAHKEIEKKAGSFIAGWHSLFEQYGLDISKYTTKEALSKVKSHSSSRITFDSDGNLTAYNEANDDVMMDRYVQYLADRDIPTTQSWYANKQKFVLEKMLRQALGLDKKQVAEVMLRINL